MKRLSTRAFVTMAALLLLGLGRARAEFVDYSYHWSISPNAVLSGGTGSAAFALTGDGPATSLVGDSNPTVIPAATITTSSSASGGAADTFNNPYSIGLRLTDKASGQFADFTFTGFGQGTDKIISGGGNDVFNVTVDLNRDYYDGGGGENLLDYSGADRGLTINLGLRWQVFTPIYEVHDRMTNFGEYSGQIQLAGQNGNSRALYNQYNGIANLLPRLGLLVTRMSPPCSRRIFRLTARPRPVPFEPFVLTKGLKTSSILSAGMPTPLSVTTMRAQP